MDTISVNELHGQLEQAGNVVLLDVRTPAEREEMDVKGSVGIPLDRIEAEKVKELIAGDKKLVIMCRSGMRATNAAKKLQAAGIENLAVMEGGILAWEKAGYPIVRGERKVLPLDRQVQLTIGTLLLIGSALAYFFNPAFLIIPAFIGLGLTFAGISGFCGMAILISRMPWNQGSAGSCSTSCSVS